MSDRRIYTTFSGADGIVKFNDQVHGTISAVNWSDYQGSDVIGELTESIFWPRDISLTQIIGSVEMRIEFKNEYGNEMTYVFDNVVVERRRVNISVNDIMIEEKFLFTASSVRIEEVSLA